MAHSVTIASILRLVYLIRRFYYVDDQSFTEFQVNLARYAIHIYASAALVM